METSGVHAPGIRAQEATVDGLRPGLEYVYEVGHPERPQTLSFRAPVAAGAVGFTFAAVGDIEWSATREAASASLDGGKTAEVRLKKFQGMTSEPVVIKNLKYWGAAKNDGFVLMPNEVEAMHVGDKAYEYHGTNGFMITVDLNSNNAPPAAGS